MGDDANIYMVNCKRSTQHHGRSGKKKDDGVSYFGLPCILLHPQNDHGVVCPFYNSLCIFLHLYPKIININTFGW